MVQQRHFYNLMEQCAIEEGPRILGDILCRFFSHFCGEQKGPDAV